ncbi:hypothetical protein F5Y15DRAFT_104153 [Xylariaceae sp. FL0016]|nr:hypothetical protein F5Y15DRAFT_104153 [Xylariaceae sp. FL0016]
MNRKEHNNIMDRHERAIAQILTRFRNMVMAVTQETPKTNIIEDAALNMMTMERETAAMIGEIENLLSLNREIKRLWMIGPLRKPGDEDDREAAMDKMAAQVVGLYSQVINLKNKEDAKKPAQQPPVGLAKNEDDAVDDDAMDTSV